MTDTIKRTSKQWRELAKVKARSEKQELAYIGQWGTVAEHTAYHSGIPYELAYPGDTEEFWLSKKKGATIEKKVPTTDNEPFSVVAVKEPLPVPKVIKHKAVLPNGRNRKPIPSFDNWFCQIFPKDITFPSWKYLSKTATDVANICRAKGNRAAKIQQKDSTGRPVFDFTVSEAEKVFKLTRPTFTKAIHMLIEIGFIEHSRPGGIVNGNGIKALYRLSDKWKSWEPPNKNNSNINKARSARKQIPSKGALNSIGKGALNGVSQYQPSIGKGALNDNAYFPV